MRLLVTFAVDAEFAPWKSRHPFVPYEFDDAGVRREFDVFRANLGANEVTVLLTGMGEENARKAISTAPFEGQDVLVSTGLAGALDENLKLGEIVVARTCRTVSRATKLQSDSGLLDLAVAAGARTVDVFLTVEAIVATATE